MRRGRSGGGLAALLQSAKAFFNNIAISDGAKIGTVNSGSPGTPDKEYLVFDRTNQKIFMYVNNVLKHSFETGQWLAYQDLLPSPTNSLNHGYSTNRWGYGYFGTQLGMHDGTRYSISLISNGAGYAGERLTVLSHLNNVGSASVVGYRYKIQASTGFVISVPGDTIATLGLMIAHEAFANGSYGRMMMLSPATDGQIVKLYFSAATTAGHYANFDGVNNGQFVDAVAPVANQCAGIIMETIAGAGLALVLIQRQ
jgi:hypothetical protein